MIRGGPAVHIQTRRHRRPLQLIAHELVIGTAGELVQMPPQLLDFLSEAHVHPDSALPW
jgi:hypothetical protein